MNAQCNTPISDRFSSLCARVFYRRSAILKNCRGEGPGDEVGTEIARMLLVSRWTLRRRVVEYGLQEVTGFSPLSDEQLDNTVRQFMRTPGNLVGYSLMSGLPSLIWTASRQSRSPVSHNASHSSRMSTAAPKKSSQFDGYPSPDRNMSAILIKVKRGLTLYALFPMRSNS